jgi:hypothetical protein
VVNLDWLDLESCDRVILESALKRVFNLSDRLLAVVGPPAPYADGDPIETPTLGDAIENLQRLVVYAEQNFDNSWGISSPSSVSDSLNEEDSTAREESDKSEGIVRDSRS